MKSNYLSYFHAIISFSVCLTIYLSTHPSIYLCATTLRFLLNVPPVQVFARESSSALALLTVLPTRAPLISSSLYTHSCLLYVFYFPLPCLYVSPPYSLAATLYMLAKLLYMLAETPYMLANLLYMLATHSIQYP